jgi:hypothetical protein
MTKIIDAYKFNTLFAEGIHGIDVNTTETVKIILDPETETTKIYDNATNELLYTDTDNYTTIVHELMKR